MSHAKIFKVWNLLEAFAHQVALFISGICWFLHGASSRVLVATMSDSQMRRCCSL